MTLSKGEKLAGCDLTPRKPIKVLSVDRSFDEEGFRGDWHEGMVFNFNRTEIPGLGDGAFAIAYIQKKRFF